MLMINKYKIAFILIISIILIAIASYLYYRYYLYVPIVSSNIVFKETNEILDEVQEIVVNEPKIEEKINYLMVDIKGAVKKPGVYSIVENSRIIDVINKAGGLTNLADTFYINMSKKIKDEMVIVIYTKNEILEYKNKIAEDKMVIEKMQNNDINDAIVDCLVNDDNITDNIDNTPSNDNNQDNNTSLIVNINNASVEELMKLSGIGETRANDIISYREKNNGFKSIDELKNVKGIGEATFAKIKNDITI